MLCNKCGQQLAEGNSVCSKCGEEQAMIGSGKEREKEILATSMISSMTKCIVFMAIGLILSALGLLGLVGIILSLADGDFETLVVSVALGLLLTPFGVLTLFAAVKSKGQYSEFKREKEEIITGIPQEVPAHLLSTIEEAAKSSNEAILFRKGGGQIISALGASSGRIILTNQRLIHESLRGKKIKVEVPLGDITHYQKAYQVVAIANNDLCDNAFILHMKQGFSLKFAVDKRSQLFLLFKHVMPHAEQLPHEAEDEASTYECLTNHPQYQQYCEQNKAANIALGLIRVIKIIDDWR